MGWEVEARRDHRGIAAGITRLGGQVQTAVWHQIRQLERDRSLNALLAVGLVTINLAAFGRLSPPIVVMDEPLTSPITTPLKKQIQGPPAFTPAGKS